MTDSSLRKRFTAHLRQILASLTRKSLNEIDADAPIERLGVRAVLQMTNELESTFGWLPKTLYFEYPTIAALAGALAESHPVELRALLGVEGEPLQRGDVAILNTPERKEADLRRPTAEESIAIVGLSCRFPHARDMHEFWENLRSGRDCIGEIPADRWDHRAYFDEHGNGLGKTYGKWGGFVEGHDRFDAPFFNIAAREAEMMDPQERLFLEGAYAAIEDAGYTPQTLNRDAATGVEHAVGVYVGLMFEEYQLFRGDILGSPASIANRVSYVCNFRGPSMSVDTMCSSSLTAIHLACQSLQKGECGAAIAGGVNLTLHPNKYLMLARLKMASPKGRCKTFGADGDGYVPGEGVGVVVLKRLSDALTSGDHIYAVIRATAINQSGKSRSYFAPSPNAQAEVIEQAFTAAGVNPRIVTYIEAHGTGTSLGDPIEIAGLTKAFRKYTSERQYCAVGSVKSNIGHCESAAGVAGLTKVLLQMKHGQLVPSLHSVQLNRNINFTDTPFVVPQVASEWRRPAVAVEGGEKEFPRIAGISSFGAGGTNAHVLVEEFSEPGDRKDTAGTPVALILSAKSEDRLRAKVADLLAAIEQGRLAGAELADIAYTLQVGREAMDHRVGMTASSIAEAAAKLRSFLEGIEGAEELHHGEVKKTSELAAAFSGDEDLSDAIESWLKKGKLAKLVELWTKGVTVDWSRMYSAGPTPRRVSLPAYPFAGDRYWVEDADGGQSKKIDRGGALGHPLVHRNSSRVGEQRYSSHFTGCEPFFADHVVYGKPMMPGVAYLEMVREAIEVAWPDRPDSAVLELRNTVWAQPIWGGEQTEVSVTLSPDSNGLIDFEVRSQDGHEEVVHFHGRAAWKDVTKPAKMDLDVLAGRTQQSELEPSDLYMSFVRAGCVHGPTFQAIRAIRHGGGELLAYLRLPKVAAGTWGDYVLHPSLMDAALQAGGALLNLSAGPSGQIRLPYALERVRVLSPCPPEMVASVRFSAGSQPDDAVVKLDIDLSDEGGNVCVEMRGFSSRVLSGARSELRSFVPTWRTARPETHGAASTRFLLLGSDPKAIEWLTESHEDAQWVEFVPTATIERVRGALAGLSFDHVIWIAPDVLRTSSEVPLIEQQESGAVALFRVVKALLDLGFADRELRWTIITSKTQRVKRDEPLQPAHAAVLGLAGSLAKEYPHWNVSLLDLDSAGSITAADCLAIAGDPRGDGLAYRSGEWFHRKFAEIATLPASPAVRYRQNGVYVVIGGAGGVGEAWTRFMIERYQADIVWIGRRPSDNVIAEKIARLGQSGPAPLYISADATKLEELDEACQTILRAKGAIHGVVHSAIVLRDQGLARMDEPAFRASLAAKVDTSVNMDVVFGGEGLDFMLFFSSIMSFTRAAGQSNYAAGCVFEDSFALDVQCRRAYPVKVVNWGYWGDVGIAAGDHYKQAMTRMGLGSIAASEGMSVLQALVDSDLNQLGVVRVIEGATLAGLDLSETLEGYPRTEATPQLEGVGRSPLRASIVERSSTATADAGSNLGKTVSAEPAAPASTVPASLREQSLREVAVEYFQQLVASTMKMRREDVEPRRTFGEYGLDSILVGQLTYRLRKTFSDVPATLLFEAESVERLTDYFLENKRDELVRVLGALVAEPEPEVAQVAMPAVPDESERRQSQPVRSVAGAIARRPRAPEQLRANDAARAVSTPHAVRPAAFDVAIIGVSGRYPQSRNLEEFWQNIARGINCISEIPRSRWSWEEHYDPERGKAGKIYSRWGGFLEGIDLFDPLFFRIAPKEAKRMDPQERLFLEACYHALEDSGHTPASLGDSEKIGVFVGVMNARYTAQPFHYSIANRVSYLFNFQGPSMAVDTACSSSLTAVHLAVESLYNGSSRCAIAGGVNTIIDAVHYMQMTELSMMSSGDQCNAFGALADGLVDAEGVGAVILKPLADAQRDGDHIYGVIKGSAINAGGRTWGYTVPNLEAQCRVVSLALERASLTADQVSYVEAHGTGTALGDPIEIDALTRAFGKGGGDKPWCSIGSVKSNIGHSESAAGIAGLTKVLLQFKYGQLAPSLHSEPPNPEIDFARTPFRVQKHLEPWQRPRREVNGVWMEIPRTAGVSSFGAGGANAHLIVQEYPSSEVWDTPAPDADVVIVLSARTADQLKQKAHDLLDLIQREAPPRINLTDMAYTLQVGREPMDERLAFVARSVDSVARILLAYTTGAERGGEVYRGRVKRESEGVSAVGADIGSPQAMAAWLADKQYSRLAENWVKGFEVEWVKVYGEIRPKRIALPGYPFARERYWLEPTGSASRTDHLPAGVLHPLVHSNKSDLSGLRYSSTFAGNEFFFADSERRSVLTAAACLEMARAALESAAPPKAEATIVELLDIVWGEPIVASSRTEISVALMPGQAGEIRFEIYGDTGAGEVVHCQGRSVQVECAPLHIDLEDLQKHVGYGQVVTSLRLPEVLQGTFAEYALHPGIIGEALQASLALVPGSADLMAVESVRILSPCSPEMVASVGYAVDGRADDDVVRLDLDVCDVQGNVCVQMRGVRWRLGPQQALPIVLPPAPSKITFVPRRATAAPITRTTPTSVVLGSPDAVTFVGLAPSGQPRIRLSDAQTPVFPAAPDGPSAVSLYDLGAGIFSIQIAAADSEHPSWEEVISDLRQALEWLQGSASSLKVLLLRGLDCGFRRAGRTAYNEAVSQKLHQTIVSFSYPVIAVLESDTIGPGFLTAALCDVMVCGGEAFYGFTNAEEDLYPTCAVTALLSERFGDVLAQDLLFLSKALTGNGLRAKGWCCPMLPRSEVEEYVQELASNLASKSQECLRLLKQHMVRELTALVGQLTRLEHSAESDRSGSISGPISSETGDVFSGLSKDRVLVIDVDMNGDLVGNLDRRLARLHQDDSYVSVVLTFKNGDTTTAQIAEEAQHVLQRVEVPVVAALTGDGRGNTWLLSLLCDACVYSREGAYSATGVEESGVAADVFRHRFGLDVASEILLTCVEYSGADLQRRVGGVTVVEHDRVLSKAMELAASCESLPRTTVAGWKERNRLKVEQGSGAAPVTWQPDEEAPRHPDVPTIIPLHSRVITATAYPEGLVVVAMEDRDAKNMFSDAFIDGVAEAFAHIAATQSYKVVVLTGYDSYFASGGTKEGLLAIQAGKARFTDRKVFQAALDCELPVIAAMQGHGIGAGWSMGMFADVVVLSEESRYVSPYMNYGFTPGAGATWVFPEKIGHDLARESLLTAKRYSGRELKDRGLAMRILPRTEVHSAAMALAKRMAEAPRRRLIDLKRRLTSSVREPLENAYRLELAMHEKTFVGRGDTLAQIHEEFYEGSDAPPPPPPQREAVQGPVAADDGDLLRTVTASLRTLLAAELQMKESDVDDHVQFIDLGLDSISGVSWTRKINEKFGTSIEATKVYSYPTIVQLGRHVKAEAERNGALMTQNAPAVSLPATLRASAPLLPPIGATASTRRLTSWRGRRDAGTVRVPDERRSLQPVAIIGMAGQFPQATNLKEFWRNIAEGRNCITEVASKRWDVSRYYQPGEVMAGKTNSRWFGALDEYDQFDPLFFNISPTEAEIMDPQQRLFLQACWHSIEDAGYDARALSASRCGVFAGCAGGDYHQGSREHQLSAHGFTGGAASILAGRISYFLNLQGPCIAIDTACSASLVALAQACDSLAGGDSDLALAGGVYVMAGPELHIKTAQAGMLSKEGRCFTFDQRADGFVPGEGVGVVLLKRLADAERDRDAIYAVVEGWGINQDGRTNGITAPNPESQARLERQIYDKYGINPAEIQLIEAHGTGTKLGDPIEVDGLKQAFRGYTQREEYCALGSVKSNIGHCATAAGIAGFIKTVLALRHKQLPPTINFEQINEHIDLAGSPFYVNTRLQDWEVGAGETRHGAVSSFGFSGTNAHVVIGEYLPPTEITRSTAVNPPGSDVIIPLSARTEERLKEKVQDLMYFIRHEAPSVELLDLAYTLQVGREEMEERAGFLAGSVGQLGDRLQAYLEGRPATDGVYRGSGKRNRESLGILSQDEEATQAVVEKWIEQRKPAKLLDLWVRGVDLDWNRLYGDIKPRRINLPVYPFARERYWIDVANKAAGSVPLTNLHPLLHRNTSDVSGVRFTSTFTGEESFLEDHRVRVEGPYAERVLPGVAYLEMARAAMDRALQHRDRAASMLELSRTVWLRPLIVPAHREVSIVVVPTDWGGVTYEISTMDAGQEIVHFQGEGVFRHGAAQSRLDLAQIEVRMQRRRLDPAEIYDLFAEAGLEYGPAHRSILAVHVGEKEALARLRLPSSVETNLPDYVLHPSLVDGALQASIGLIADEGAHAVRRYVPFGLESLRVERACTREMTAWIRYADGGTRSDEPLRLDIDLCDQDGNVCVQMAGFTARVLNVEPGAAGLIGSDSEIRPSDFEDDFYERIIAAVANGDVSIEEAVELG